MNIYVMKLHSKEPYFCMCEGEMVSLSLMLTTACKPVLKRLEGVRKLANLASGGGMTPMSLPLYSHIFHSILSRISVLRRLVPMYSLGLKKSG